MPQSSVDWQERSVKNFDMPKMSSKVIGAMLPSERGPAQPDVASIENMAIIGRTMILHRPRAGRLKRPRSVEAIGTADSQIPDSLHERLYFEQDIEPHGSALHPSSRLDSPFNGSQ